MLGAATIPFAFLIVWEMTSSLEASVLSSLFFIAGTELKDYEYFLNQNWYLTDVGLITLNQYILLDPILLFFVMGSVLGMVKVSGNSSGR